MTPARTATRAVDSVGEIAVRRVARAAGEREYTARWTGDRYGVSTNVNVEDESVVRSACTHEVRVGGQINGHIDLVSAVLG